MPDAKTAGVERRYPVGSLVQDTTLRDPDSQAPPKTRAVGKTILHLSSNCAEQLDAKLRQARTKHLVRIQGPGCGSACVSRCLRPDLFGSPAYPSPTRLAGGPSYLCSGSGQGH